MTLGKLPAPREVLDPLITIPGRLILPPVRLCPAAGGHHLRPLRCGAPGRQIGGELLDAHEQVLLDRCQVLRPQQHEERVPGLLTR